METAKSGLLTESDLLKESELIKKAASYVGIVLHEQPEKHLYPLRFRSEIIGTFDLDEGFLAALKKAGFSFKSGIKPPYNEMVYLSGNSDQKGQETFESDCWAWEKTRTDYQLTINLNLWVEESKRGVVCEPNVWGNCSGGACHRPTINKFVAVVASHFPNAHPLIKRTADNDSRAIIYWSDIGLGGIKSLGYLFNELYGQNKRINQLAGSILSPFIPSPKTSGFGIEDRDRSFVLESDQSKLFEQWKKQLQELKFALI